nr:disease resistance protein rpp4 [Quercus suber]
MGLRESLSKKLTILEQIELKACGIEQLPSEFSNLHKLKLIDLSDSQNLCQTPTFNGLPNIERLIFQGCTGLHALHPSVGSLERLILLNLKDFSGKFRPYSEITGACLRCKEQIEWKRRYGKYKSPAKWPLRMFEKETGGLCYVQ